MDELLKDLVKAWDKVIDRRLEFGKYGAKAKEDILTAVAAIMHDDGWVKTVRCGECINWDECGKYGICCLSGRGRRNPDAYCSEGERKEGANGR